MFKKHSDVIRENLSTLVENTDLSTIIPHIEKKNVLNQETIRRILNPAHDVKLQTTNFYTAVIKRGPQAFAKLRDALQESNHLDLAELLKHMDAQVNRRPSLNSLGSRDSMDSDVDRSANYCQEMENRESPVKCTTESDSNVQPYPPEEETGNSIQNRTSFPRTSSNSPSPSSDKLQDHRPLRKKCVEPYNLHDYYKGIMPFPYSEHLLPSDVVNIRAQTSLPVKVVSAKEWKNVGHFCYKMDSYPRGCALVVNNIEFKDEKTYQRRKGAENDQKRLTALLEQLYFQVEYHENKTRREMHQIVQDFSQKEELMNVDSVMVVFMSHGAEGASEEDTEIIGTDGMGLKTREIVSCFSNDRCRALVNKPKIFIFQACRGVLTDPGVLFDERWTHHRTEMDGRKIESRSDPIRMRSTSDMFIAYPVPPGRPANRDIFNGTWFIQTIVDVFAEHAFEYDLEDMFKMVDKQIKNLNNLEVLNFQAVSTVTIGWNKRLFFNPGLRKRKTKKCEELSTAEEEGTDVVDNSRDVVQEDRARTEEPECEDRHGCLTMPKCVFI